MVTGVLIIVFELNAPELLDAILDFESGKDKECVEKEEENDNDYGT